MSRHTQRLHALLLLAALAIASGIPSGAVGGVVAAPGIAPAAGAAATIRGSGLASVNSGGRWVVPGRRDLTGALALRAALPLRSGSTDTGTATPATVAPAGLGPAVVRTFPDKVSGTCNGAPCAGQPNPYVAASREYVVQTSADSVRITDRTGKLLQETPLSGFFGPGAGSQRVARVVWDALHGRWLATERDDDCQTGFVSIAASAGPDPTGGWLVWLFSRPGYSADMPSIGVSNDKAVVGLTWRAMTPIAGGGCDRAGAGGAGGYVFDTASLYAGDYTLPFTDLGMVSSVVAWRPAANLTPASEIHLIAALPAGTGTYSFGYVRITGTNATENVARAAVAPVALPAWQAPSGGALAVDWQPLDAVWQSGTLWSVMNVLCTPNGDSASRPCVRVVGVATATAAGAEDIVIGFAGQDVFDGGVGVTGEGATFVGWSQAPSGTKTISTYASYRLPGDGPHTLRTPLLLAGAAGTFTGSGWGSQLGVAQDPIDPRSVWIAAPYSAASGGWAARVVQVAEAGTLRDAGADRFTTAAMVSAGTFPAGSAFGQGVDVAYVTYAFNFPDALAGAAAAGTVKGPVLLAATHGPLSAATQDELIRLHPKRIVVLGSSAVVGDDVAALLAYIAPRVDRYAGPDRFATAATVSANTFPAGPAFGAGVDVAYVAYAFNFPDALAGAAAAGTVHGPVLLADKSGTLNPSTAAELTRLHPKRIVMLGSSAVVGDDVAAQLQQFAPGLSRYAGMDRFTTAVSVSAKTFPAGPAFGAGVDVAYVAYAFDFPDALAGAAAAGTLAGPVLLTAASGPLDPATAAELTRLNPKQIVILGSAGVVGADVGQQLAGFVPH